MMDTIFQPPKKDILENPEEDRANREAARQMTVDLNNAELKLNEREISVQRELQTDIGRGRVLELQAALSEIAQERKDIKKARQEVHRLRTKKSMATARKALAKKRAKDAGLKKKLLKQMKRKKRR